MAAPLASLLRRYSQVFPVGCAGSRFPEILKRRRRRHLENLDSFAIFSGVPHEPGAENLWHMNALKIFQEPAILHLCGINQPKVIVALVPGRKSEEILFLPEKDPAREFWDGVRFGVPAGNPKHSRELEEVQRLTGIEDVRSLGEFDAWFQELVKKCQTDFGYVFYHHYQDPSQGNKTRVTQTDRNFEFKQKLDRISHQARKRFVLKTCAPLHFQLRLPLEAEQVRDTDTAVGMTRDAFLETLSSLRNLKDENALAAHLEYGMRRRSPFGLSFPSIVAGGKNATVLHYLKNDEPLNPKGLVLMDFGARFGTMHADITRTVPVSGRFNPLQELLYQLVLDALKVNQRNARPGNTLRKMNEEVWKSLEAGMQEKFFSRGGKAIRAYSGKPHGVSHLMGEQEHDGDPHRIYQDQPLQLGWQISNEPGLYGHFRVRLKGKLYSEWIGIRIEDDLLITKTGCRNLSESIPREVVELESLLS